VTSKDWEGVMLFGQWTFWKTHWEPSKAEYQDFQKKFFFGKKIFPPRKFIQAEKTI